MTTVQSSHTVHPVRVETTRPRVTPEPPGRRFREALGESARALLGGVEAASSLVPVGGVVSAAVRAATPGGGSPAAAPGAGVARGGASDLAGAVMDDTMEYLRIQQQMQAESRRYSTLSNVMKACHETAKNAINNIR